MSQAAECPRGKEGTIKAMSNPFPKDAQGTPVTMFYAIGELIKERLDLGRVVQTRQDLAFGLGQYDIKIFLG
jgi:hypothetical protein